MEVQRAVAKRVWTFKLAQVYWTANQEYLQAHYHTEKERVGGPWARHHRLQNQAAYNRVSEMARSRFFAKAGAQLDAIGALGQQRDSRAQLRFNQYTPAIQAHVSTALREALVTYGRSQQDPDFVRQRAAAYARSL